MTTSDHTDVPFDATAELRQLVEKVTNEGAPQPAGIVHVNVAAPKKAPKDKSVNRDKPELPAYLLAIVAIIAIAFLTWHGDAVPEVLNLVAIGALGIGGAVTQTTPATSPKAPPTT